MTHSGRFTRHGLQKWFLKLLQLLAENQQHTERRMSTMSSFVVIFTKMSSSMSSNNEVFTSKRVGFKRFCTTISEQYAQLFTKSLPEHLDLQIILMLHFPGDPTLL